MGLNTPAIILNDMIHDLERSPEAGPLIARAALHQGADYGYSAKAERLGVKVLPAGHSGAMQIVAIGGNTLRQIGWSNSCHDSDEELLRKLADQMGYRLVKKGSRAA